METLLLLVSQFAVGAKHDLEMAGEILFGEEIGDTGDAFALLAGNLKQRRILSGDFRDGRVAQEADHLTGKVRGTVALADEVIDLPKNLFALPFGDGLHHLFENVSRGGADEIANRVGGNTSAGGGDGLVEDGESVAHGAVASFGEQGKSVVIGFDLFARDEVAQLGNNGLELYGPKTKMLAARADGLRNILRLRSGEHENDVVGRLFEGLEQRVEGGVGDLVSFVENINFEAVAGRAIAGGLAKFADFIDATVGGGVDFNNVDGVSGANFGTGVADPAGPAGGVIFGSPVGGGARDGAHIGVVKTPMSA